MARYLHPMSSILHWNHNETLLRISAGIYYLYCSSLDQLCIHLNGGSTEKNLHTFVSKPAFSFGFAFAFGLIFLEFYAKFEAKKDWLANFPWLGPLFVTILFRTLFDANQTSTFTSVSSSTTSFSARLLKGCSFYFRISLPLAGWLPCSWRCCFPYVRSVNA